MGFKETVEVQIDIAANKGTAALQNLKTNVSQADGAFAKMGAAAKGAGGVLSAMPFPVVAGAALGAAAGAIKLGTAFADAALDAKKMSSATGLNVTAASEWIAAADDVGISTDQISSAFGKATKAIGMAPEKFEALGVSVVQAKDGTVDMNATLLNAIDTINRIQDPTQKAALASQLFGKSWAELTPLITQGGAAIAETMRQTSEAQRITEKEVDSAKKWQATMDDLSDVADNLKLSLGRLVVEGLGPILETVADVVGPLAELADGLADVRAEAQKKAAASGSSWFDDLQGLLTSSLPDAFKFFLDKVDEGTGGTGERFRDMGDAALQLGDIVEGQGQKFVVLANETKNVTGMTDQQIAALVEQARVTVASGQATTDFGAALEAEKNATDAATKAIDALNHMRDAAIAALTRQQDASLSLIDSEVGYKRAVDDVGVALGEFQIKQGLVSTTVDDAKTSTDEAAEAQQSMEGSSRSLEDAISKTAAQAVIYAQDQAEAAGQTFGTEQSIAAQIGALQELKAKYPELAAPIDAHIAKLNAIPTTKTTTVDVQTAEAAQKLENIIDQMAQIRDKTVHVNAIGGVNVNGAAAGGSVSGLTLVGEKGPELVAFPSSGAFVFTAEQTRRLKAGGMAGGGSTGGDGVVVDGVFYSTPPPAAPAPVPNTSLPFGYFADAAGLHQPTGGPNYSGASTSLIPSTMPWGWWDTPGAFEGLSPNSPSRPPVGVGSNRTAAGTTINIYTGANPQEVVEAIRRYERMNGTSWRN